MENTVAHSNTKIFWLLWVTMVFLLCLIFSIGDAQAKSSKDFFYKEMVINVPISDVDRVITDYSNYYKYFHHMEVSRVLKTNGDNSSDCYFEIEVFGRTFWAKVRLDRTYVSPNHIIVKETTYDTNLKELNGQWELTKIDDQNTLVVIHGSAKPYMLLPDSFLKNLLDKEVSAAVRRINRLLTQ